MGGGGDADLELVLAVVWGCGRHPEAPTAAAGDGATWRRWRGPADAVASLATVGGRRLYSTRCDAVTKDAASAAVVMEPRTRPRAAITLASRPAKALLLKRRRNVWHYAQAAPSGGKMKMTGGPRRQCFGLVDRLVSYDVLVVDEEEEEERSPDGEVLVWNVSV